jgi:hypothetical protein
MELNAIDIETRLGILESALAALFKATGLPVTPITEAFQEHVLLQGCTHQAFSFHALFNARPPEG